MKIFANKNTLVALLSFAFASVICLPIQAQFGDGNLDSALEQDIAKLEEKVRNLEQKVNITSKFMLDLKKSPLADTQNSEVSVFRLKYIRVSSAANTISALLGKEGFRLAIEETANQLIVSAPAEISEAIGELLHKIDVTPTQKNKNRVTSQKQSAPKSLQVHTFWLAAGLLDNSTTEHLPESVIEALNKIGITNPGIVTQSTTSLIAKDVSTFKSFMHATFKNQEFLFTNNAELSLNEGQQIELHVHTQILKRSENKNACELRGSMTAPLGHYMVLGTTNYVTEDSQENTLDTSRFAFVIQIVEADSFVPEK